MTPKEKAKELFDKFFKYAGNIHLSKNDNTFHISNICIDEIILFSENLGKQLFKQLGTESYSSRCKNYDMKNYWQEVKKELEKL